MFHPRLSRRPPPSSETMPSPINYHEGRWRHHLENPQSHINMSLLSCKAFRQLPADFFSPKYDKLHSESSSQTLPITIAYARNCASSGCPFCTILLASARPQFLPDEVLYNHAVTMKRAMIDSEQSFQLCIGLDDFSRTFFYRVPPSWSRFHFADVQLIYVAKGDRTSYDC